MVELITKTLPLRGRIVKVVPLLEGHLIRLGVSPEVIDENERIELLSFFKEEIPQLYWLRKFLLSTPPRGSASPHLGQTKWDNFASWRVQSQRDTSVWYQVQIWEDGLPTCTCPDFFHRRKGTSWCKHITGLHQFLRETLPKLKEAGFVALPAWSVKQDTPAGEVLRLVGGPFQLERLLPLEPGGYSRIRGEYPEPRLGIELEIPNSGNLLGFLKKILGRLLERGIILTYENDVSVGGGEVKFPPIPATLSEIERVVRIIEGIKSLFPPLFENRGVRAGMHVHINVYPLSYKPTAYAYIGRWFMRVFDLPKIFGRSFNRYAGSAISLRSRYCWLNLTPLPRTVEVRLGSAYGDPRKILLGSLLLQRIIWARKDGFRLPSGPQGRILERLLTLFSEEERGVMAPFIREHMSTSSVEEEGCA